MWGSGVVLLLLLLVVGASCSRFDAESEVAYNSGINLW
jgi:hypothetical protein